MASWLGCTKICRRRSVFVQPVHATQSQCEAMLKFAAILTVLNVLEVPTALLGDHYRHGFDLGRCFEARVPPGPVAQRI